MALNLMKKQQKVDTIPSCGKSEHTKSMFVHSNQQYFTFLLSSNENSFSGPQDAKLSHFLNCQPLLAFLFGLVEKSDVTQIFS
jgi:hypothetical protein